MIGSLTIEKANLNISYMLASLKLLSDAGGKLSRGEFISRMASFMGVSPVANDGKENRVPYNKTKFDRYFGFIDVNPNGDLLLTPRGSRIVPLIVKKTGCVDPDAIYGIDPSGRNKVQELFLDSCCFDSFGSYNCGAETSNSDIEPPRVILKALAVLGEMTKWELGYVLWGMEVGALESFDVALQKVVNNRNDLAFDYQYIIGKWGKTNFVKDFKMVDLFRDENVGILEETYDGCYRIQNTLSQDAKQRIAGMNPIAWPIQMVLGSSYSKAETMDWIRNSVLGRIADPALIYECDVASGISKCKELLANAINKAYSRRKYGAVDTTGVCKEHQNSTVTWIVKGLVDGTSNIDEAFPNILSSFVRKNNFKANDHGWTLQPGQDHELYNLLIANNTFATRFGHNNIVLPANLNLIGVT